mgnify:FL=1
MMAQAEMKTFRRWLKNHPDRDVHEFHADYLSPEQMSAIAADGGRRTIATEMAADRPQAMKETATAQPPFAWRGMGIPDYIKALILQLDPDDDEAERAVRILTEKKTRRNLQAAMDDILADITRQVPTDVEETVRQTRTHFQRDQALYDALTRALQDGVDLGVSVAVQQFEAIGFGMDYTLVNTAARRWAEQHAGDLIHQVEQTTVDSVRQAVGRWIGNGEPLQALIDDLTPTFGAARAERIATTEVTRSFAEANRIAYRESGVVEKIEWRTARDEFTCPQCFPLHGKQTEINGTFDGFYPPRHVNCLLSGTEVISFGPISAVAKSFYIGRCIEITLADGRKLAVTENHPILTLQGFISAKFLRHGDNVLSTANPKRIADAIDPDNDYRPIAIEQIFDTLVKSGKMRSICVPAAAEQFHGDGRNIHGDIDIVHVDSFLWRDRQSGVAQIAGERDFDNGGIVGITLTGKSMPLTFGMERYTSTRGIVSGSDLGDTFIHSHSRPFEELHFGLTPNMDTAFDEMLMQGIATDTPFSREFMLRFAGQVAMNEIVKIRNFEFSGHVYDLQSDMYGLYSGNGVIVKNCRCWIVPVIEEQR